MKQGKLVKAYITLDKLAKITLPLSIANKIFLLKEKLEPHYTFQNQEELKSFKENKGFYDSEHRMSFPSIDDYNNFEKRMEELRELEIDVDIIPFDVPISDNIMLSANEIKNLTDFINFV